MSNQKDTMRLYLYVLTWLVSYCCHRVGHFRGQLAVHRLHGDIPTCDHLMSVLSKEYKEFIHSVSVCCLHFVVFSERLIGSPASLCKLDPKLIFRLTEVFILFILCPPKEQPPKTDLIQITLKLIICLSFKELRISI